MENIYEAELAARVKRQRERYRTSLYLMNQAAFLSDQSRRLIKQASERPRPIARALRAPSGPPPTPDRNPEVETLVAELRADNEHLRAALATRDLIWEAKLVIAAQMRCEADQAHQILVAQSQHENRKIREIAADIVARAAESHGQRRPKIPPPPGWTQRPTA